MDLGNVNLQHPSSGRGGVPVVAAAAEQLYQRATYRTWTEMVGWHLAGRLTTLPVMAETVPDCFARDAIEVGLRSVPLLQVVGTVETARGSDFDSQFRPIKAYLKDRWIAVAICCQRGHCASAVDLLEADGLYFVVDGHIRVSVARALGWDTIPACVTSLVPRLVVGEAEP